MEHAHEGADAAAAAAAVTVAPLLQLRRSADKADELSRFARAQELYERALAAAEQAQPRDSLIIVVLLEKLNRAHYLAARANPSSPATAERMELSLRSLHLLHARWQAGTLFAPTAEEVAYLVEDKYPWLSAQMCGAYFYLTVATAVAADQILAPCRGTPAEAEPRVPAVYGALRAALEMDARGMLERNPRTGQAWPASSASPGSAAAALSLFKITVHGVVTL
jgi:hypothetical protein